MKKNKKNGVMVVDDDQSCRDTYRDYLYCLSPDLKVTESRNGDEAKSKLEELLESSSPDFPDAVLTDFRMTGGLTGLGLLKFIRNHPHPLIKKMRVIMVSGDTTQQLRISTAELGCRLFRKPANMNEVFSALLEE